MNDIEPLNMDFIKGLVRQLELILATAFEIFKDDPDWQGRTGAYFCVAHKETGAPLFVVPVLNVPREKARKYCRLSQEKAQRLSDHPGHLTSKESANPKEDKWPGAIKGDKHIYSLSGLPGDGDEASMMVLEQTNATVIQRLVNNPYYERLNAATQ